MSKKSFVRMLTFLAAAVSALLFSSFVSRAEEITYRNDKTGYRVLIEDQAELLTPEEEETLTEDMKPLTDYGSAAFVTVSENAKTAKKFAESFSYEHFHNDSSVVFLIDMDNRQIYIASAGAMEKNIGKSGAETITDNVYRYASNKKYYECAAAVYEQILSLEEGKRIAQSMKYINNALLAVLLAMLIMFVTVTRLSDIRAASDRQLLAGTAIGIAAAAAAPMISSRGKTSRIIPRSSGSGGGSSGGGGGGSSGGGGGGFSGSGGGHSF